MGRGPIPGPPLKGTYMKGALALRQNILPPFFRDVSATGTPITAAAYATLVASLPAACSAVQVQNTSGSAIKLAIGAAASEVDQIIVAPQAIEIIPVSGFKKALRLSGKAMVADTATGVLVINFLG